TIDGREKRTTGFAGAADGNGAAGQSARTPRTSRCFKKTSPSIGLRLGLSSKKLPRSLRMLPAEPRAARRDCLHANSVRTCPGPVHRGAASAHQLPVRHTKAPANAPSSVTSAEMPSQRAAWQPGVIGSCTTRPSSSPIGAAPPPSTDSADTEAESAAVDGSGPAATEAGTRFQYHSTCRLLIWDTVLEKKASTAYCSGMHSRVMEIHSIHWENCSDRASWSDTSTTHTTTQTAVTISLKRAYSGMPVSLNTKKLLFSAAVKLEIAQADDTPCIVLMATASQKDAADAVTEDQPQPTYEDMLRAVTKEVLVNMEVATTYPAIVRMSLPDHLSYEEFRQRLSERYTQPADTLSFREEFRFCIQGKNESVDDFGDRLIVLADKAFPHFSPVQKDAEIVDQFVVGIRATPSAREQLILVRPANLIAAKRTFKRLETAAQLAQRVALGHRPVRVVDNVDGETPAAAAAGSTPKQARPEEAYCEICCDSRQQRALEALRRQLEELSRRTVGNRGADNNCYQPRAPATNQSGDQSQVLVAVALLAEALVAEEETIVVVVFVVEMLLIINVHHHRQKYTHCLNRICILCFSKAKELRSVTPWMLAIINRHSGWLYDLHDNRVPKAICGTCRFALQQLEKGQRADVPPMYDFRDVQPLPVTRSVGQDGCDCKICSTARCRVHPPEANVPKRSVGRPSLTADEATTPKPEMVKVCSFCISPIGRGKPHTCNRPTRLQNAHALLQEASPEFPERLATTIVRQKLITSGSGDTASGITVLASNAGPSMRLAVNPPPPKPTAVFTADNMRHLQGELGLSSRKTEVVLRNLRSSIGASAVQSNIRQTLREMDHELDDLFQAKQLAFIREERGRQTPAEQWAVVCTDVVELLGRMIANRRLMDVASTVVRIGIDGGGGFLKLSISVFDLCVCAGEEQQKGADRRFLDTGVHRAVILGIAPNTQENHRNLECLWESCRLQLLSANISIACDLKLANILLGLMAHSSSHPCTWCNVNKGSLDSCGEPRTFGSLSEKYQAYLAAGGERQLAKHFDNVVQPSIFSAGVEVPVLHIVPPPELHLLTGAVHVLYEGLHGVWPESEAWLTACNVQRDKHHGGSFTGNASRKLLRNVDLLEAMCPMAALPFVAALRALNSVVVSCFGSELRPNFEQAIQEFRTSYADLGISISPKIHAIFHHVGDFCRAKDKTGLGPWSEQCTESMHRDFLLHWERYKSWSSTHLPSRAFGTAGRETGCFAAVYLSRLVLFALALTTLAGDIETNPGPACNSCNGPIRTGMHSLPCEVPECSERCHCQKKCSGMHRAEIVRSPWRCSVHRPLELDSASAAHLRDLPAPEPRMSQPTRCHSCSGPIRTGTTPLTCAAKGCALACHRSSNCSHISRYRGAPSWLCPLHRQQAVQLPGAHSIFRRPALTRRQADPTTDRDLNDPSDAQRRYCAKCSTAIRRGVAFVKCNSCSAAYHKCCTGLNRNAADAAARSPWDCPVCTARTQGAPAPSAATSRVPLQDKVARDTKFADSLRLLQWNADGIASKLPELAERLSDSDIDIAAVQETKLSNRTQLPKINGYIAVRKDRGDGSGGGLLLLIRDKLAFRSSPQPTATADMEIQTVDIQISTANWITITNVYAPPVRTCVEDRQLPDWNHLGTPSQGIILGDFNSHSPAWDPIQPQDERGSTLLDWSIDTQLEILNDGSPTRVNKATGGESSPDVSFASSKLASKCTWQVSDDLGSDHTPIVIRLDLKVRTLPKAQSRLIWRKQGVDWNAFQTVVEDKFKALHKEHLTFDARAKRFNDIVMQAANLCIGKVRTSHRPRPWLTPELKAAIKLRNRLRRSVGENREDWLSACANVHKIARATKEAAWRDTITDLEKEPNSNKAWKFIRSLNGTPDSNCPNEALQVGNKVLTDPRDKANAFAKQYASVSRYHISHSDRATIREAKAILRLPLPLPGSTHDGYAAITEQELDSAIQHQRANGAAGADEVTPRFIKALGPLARAELLSLFNWSFQHAAVAQSWRTAIIIPLLKAGKSARDIAAFRPISLTSCIVKLLERILVTRLHHLAERHGWISPNQAGFRANYSCEDQLLRVTQDISDGMNLKPSERTIIALLDFCKAFDKVWRERLITVMARKRVPLVFIKWTAAFLRHRIARVQLHGARSSPVIMRQGLPQGSVIAPFLFLIFIDTVNDVVNPPAEISMYADDIALRARHRNKLEAQRAVQRALDNVARWSNEHKMVLNPDKSEAAFFSTDTSEAAWSPAISIEGRNLRHNPTPRLLGLTLDRTLSFRSHLEHVCNRTTSRCRLLACLASKEWGWSKKLLLRIYRAMQLSIINFAAPAWHPWLSESAFQQLERAQNAALRIVTGQHRTTPVEALRLEAGICSVRTGSNVICLTAFERAQRLPDSHPCRIAATGNTAHRLRRNSWRNHVTDLLPLIASSVTPRAMICTARPPPWDPFSTDVRVDMALPEPGPARTATAIDTIRHLPGLITIYCDGSASGGTTNGGASAIVTTEDSITNRADAVLLARLRSGHCTLFNAYRSIVDPAVDPACHRCGHPCDDLEHWLDCPALAGTRLRLLGGPTTDISSISADPLGFKIAPFMDSTGAASPELQSAVSVLLLACTLSCLSIMTGLCLCVRFKGLLHGRVKAPDPEAEVGAGRGGGDGGGGGRSSCASSGNNNSSGLAKNGKLPPADWRRSGGNHENHSYYSRDAAGSDIYESAAPSAGEAAAAATTAVRQDPRQSAIGRRLSGLRASFLARLRRSDLPGAQAATSATKKPTAAQRRPRLESQLSIRSQPADRELPPVPQQQPPLPPPPPQPPEAATGRSLLKRHLQDFPLPGIAHRLGFGRPASSAAAAAATPGNPRNTLPAATAAPAPAPRANASPRLPAAASVYTIDSDLTSEIDPLYSAIRRHSGAGQDEPATATPTPVARRRHAVEPPQQQQHVYASICKTLPSSLNNTADSASSDAAAAAATAAPAEQSASSGGAGGGQPPPLPSRNYRREEVDRILQEPAAYYSNIDLDSAGS
uniref:RING-type domain-containing protein n=1 Tax=Macrostomum lignano TaxID=282301 RepID=A0A1I8I211_9PLAT